MTCSYQERIGLCLADLQTREMAHEDLDAYTSTVFAGVLPRTLSGRALLSAIGKEWDKERVGASLEQRARRIAQVRELGARGL